MDRTITEALIKQNLKRISQNEQVIHKLVGLLDLGTSTAYFRNETINVATTLGNTLGQMDSDLTTLIDLLNQKDL